jgi:hypothetical protein
MMMLGSPGPGVVGVVVVMVVVVVDVTVVVVLVDVESVAVVVDSVWAEVDPARICRRLLETRQRTQRTRAARRERRADPVILAATPAAHAE